MQVTNLIGHETLESFLVNFPREITHVKFYKLTTATAVHLELTYHEVALLKQQLNQFHLLHWVYMSIIMITSFMQHY